MLLNMFMKDKTLQYIFRTVALGLFGISLSGNAAAQIYSCTDAQGRRITSDRPIAACLDREQKQLGSSGVVRRVIPPSYTAAELKEQEHRQRQAQAQAAQKRAQEKALAALVQRYPTSESHQKERLREAATIEARIRNGYKRVQDLKKQQDGLDKEFAFYAKNPKNTPRVLRIRKNALKKNSNEIHQYIAEQSEELEKLHKHFDQERKTLMPFWEK